MMSDADQILAMIRSGGVFHNVSGSNPEEAFADIVQRVPLPAGVTSTDLLNGLIERERLMTTSVGSGIAIPHPRNPVIQEEADERMYVCYLDRALNFDAMDGKPVYVLFVILSSSSQNYLRALSRLSWLFQQESFQSVLMKKPDTNELTDVIQQYYNKE